MATWVVFHIFSYQPMQDALSCHALEEVSLIYDTKIFSIEPMCFEPSYLKRVYKIKLNNKT